MEKIAFERSDPLLYLWYYSLCITVYFSLLYIWAICTSFHCWLLRCSRPYFFVSPQLRCFMSVLFFFCTKVNYYNFLYEVQRSTNTGLGGNPIQCHTERNG